MFSKRSKCEGCRYFFTADTPPVARCKAYPTGIPKRIFNGEKDHNRHRPFDKGYRYTPIMCKEHNSAEE